MMRVVCCAIGSEVEYMSRFNVETTDVISCGGGHGAGGRCHYALTRALLVLACR